MCKAVTSPHHDESVRQSSSSASPSKRSVLRKSSSSSKKKKTKEPRPPTWKVWLVASRPHTLTAAIAPCMVGSSIVYAQTGGIFPARITASWTLFCILVQLGTNLHNDYADFVKGADTDARVGQSRATQKGWLTPQETALGATTVLVGNLVIGLYFLVQLSLSNQGQLDGLWLFVVLSSIFNAFAYTGGPYPLGYLGFSDNFSIAYSGLGDIFVFLYFGCVATIAIPYLHERTTANSSTTASECLSRLLLNPEQPTLLLSAMAVGFMATNILVVNNLRDRHTDVHAGKRTLAVRLGGTFCRVQYTLLAFASYLLVLLDYTLQQQQQQHHAETTNYWRLLPLLSIPLARREIVSIWSKEGGALNSHVGKTALLELLFCLLLSVGLVKSAA